MEWKSFSFRFETRDPCAIRPSGNVISLQHLTLAQETTPHTQGKAMVQPSSSSSRTDSPPPLKRSRHTDMDSHNTNGHPQLPHNPTGQSHPHGHSRASAGTLPPLSLSILGVEPMDEFIKEIADFIHHMIVVEAVNHPPGNVEVEAKVGVLRDRASGRRLQMPSLVETST